MNRTKVATRYYGLYIFNGEYCIRSASNYLNAVEDLEDVAKQGAEPLGIYDLHDWRFDWNPTTAISRSCFRTDQLATFKKRGSTLV